MRSLYESLLDDEDELVDRATDAVMVKFIKHLKENNPRYIDKINSNGTTIIISSHAYIHVEIPIPSYVNFDCDDSSVLHVHSEIEDLKSIKDVNRLYFAKGSSIGKSNKINAKIVQIENQDFESYDWLPNNLNSFVIKNWLYDYKGTVNKMNLKNKFIKYICIDGADLLAELENCNCDRLEIKNCQKLKILNNIKCADCLEIYKCKNLVELVGKNDFSAIRLDASCKKLKPESLPQTVKRIWGAYDLDQRWLPSNIEAILPNINLNLCTLPEESKFKAANNSNYKIGAWVVVRGASKYHGAFGSSRGTLAVDKIIKINKTTGNISTEYNGSRKSCDFEIMRDANPNKDWSYVDQNDVNDITGVGIEVGDEVVSYAASGSFGKNNGIVLDKVIAITKARVRCEKSGLRRPQDICILRSQEICDKQLKKGG